MGNEMHCPCYNKSNFPHDDSNKTSGDIIDKINEGKLLPDKLGYDYNYDQTKACLIKADEMEGFFANRNLLKLSVQKEINLYYNLVFITNYVSMNRNIFILLEYTPGMEDKSIRSTYTYNKKRNSSVADYTANYKVEKINLVSLDKKKVSDQILYDLNANVKKDYMFLGIVNDGEIVNFETMNVKNSVNNLVSKTIAPRNFKLLYKRTLVKENVQVKYSIAHFEGNIDRESVYQVIEEQKKYYKVLKSIMIDASLEQMIKKNYYFIFEENTTNFKDIEYSVIEMDQGNNPDKLFIQDIVKKLNDLQNAFKLCCIVNDDRKFFLILCADLDDLQTPNEG